MVNFRSRRSIIAVAAIALFVIISTVFLCRGNSRPVVSVAQARQGRIVEHVSATGNLRPVIEVNISSDVTGRIIALSIAEGDTVDSGQTLVQIDSNSFRAQVDQAKASLDLAVAGRRQSEAVFRRSRDLFKLNLISKQEIEVAQTQFDLDKARVRQAKAALDQALDQLGNTTIISPLRGVVVTLNVDMGEGVVTGTLNVPGSVLMVVADLSHMEVRCEVDETDVPRVKRGQEADLVVDALPQKKFNGIVTEVGNAALSPSANAMPGQTTGETQSLQNAPINYNVVVLIRDSLSLLKPDMTADVQIITAQKEDALIVPIQAVVTQGAPQANGAEPNANASGPASPETAVVYIYENGAARMLPVQTGLTGDDVVEVTRGLTAGQYVITGPFAMLRALKDGQKVKIE